MAKKLWWFALGMMFATAMRQRCFTSRPLVDFLKEKWVEYD